MSLITIWRPSVPDSLDGLPLATTVRGLFSEFPYDRLPSNSFVALSLRPDVVFGLIVFYLLSKSPLKLLKETIGLDPKSAVFRSLIAFHNLALAIFSLIVAWNTWPLVISHWMERGFMSTYCDTDGTFWRNGLGAWATIFYISKYYEFIDTWILVLKGKEASFLQVYHHTGVVLTMWGGVSSQSAWLFVVVGLNSIIHTLMYTYFFIKTLCPDAEIKAARHLTMAQIAQFITGITTTLGVLIMGDSCDTQSSRFSLLCLDIYGLGLISLFVAFAKRKYKKA